ncbi:MAG: HEPN domain-containing protein [Bacteroidales bacterium]|nr:HEPN domain-containing protein [Bacteroidales bacterium]
MNIDGIFEHWIVSSDRDYETMINLYKTNDYHWSLFMGHLVIEKLLKAAIVKTTSAHAPLLHDLRRLSKLTGITFDNEQNQWLDTITSFNINARYDSYKQEFYKKCTLEYSNMWIGNIKKLQQWIKTKL